MGERLSWKEIEKKYPDEWVLVVDLDMGEMGSIEEATLIAHSKNKEEIFSYPIEAERVGLLFTGESQFRGFRSHAEHHTV